MSGSALLQPARSVCVSLSAFSYCFGDKRRWRSKTQIIPSSCI